MVFGYDFLSILDASLPPIWQNGQWPYILGTDFQGRDIFSSILYGTRISLCIAGISVLLAVTIGTILGLYSGYFKGFFDHFIMRLADIQITFPALLVALLVDGVCRAIIPVHQHDYLAFIVLVVSITLSGWVQFARTVRASVISESSKEYVQAAKMLGRSSSFILFKHILRNITGPIIVIATLQLGLCIIIEATLSYLGVGLPPTQPSLGTLIRIGNDYLFSGEWWCSFFPGSILAILILSINFIGDWLKTAFNLK